MMHDNSDFCRSLVVLLSRSVVGENRYSPKSQAQCLAAETGVRDDEPPSLTVTPCGHT